MFPLDPELSDLATRDPELFPASGALARAVAEAATKVTPPPPPPPGVKVFVESVGRSNVSRVIPAALVADVAAALAADPYVKSFSVGDSS